MASYPFTSEYPPKHESAQYQSIGCFIGGGGSDDVTPRNEEKGELNTICYKLINTG